MRGLRPGKDVGMSVSEAVTKRRRRSFSPEFKAEIVALCQLPGNTVTRSARSTTWPRRRCAAGSARPRSTPG